MLAAHGLSLAARAGAALCCSARPSPRGGCSGGAQAQAQGPQQSQRLGLAVAAHGLQGAGSAIVEHRRSRSVAFEIFLDQ